jgi:hypothetical protein
MALTPLHVRDYCYAGYSGGGLCKYLDTLRRTDGTSVNVCTKLHSGAYDKLKKKRGSYKPTGDNCAGYLYLEYKKQGYDVKP